MEAWKEELYHHGIKGQKWGIRNGPPYPLDENQYSGRKKRLVNEINTRAKYVADNITFNKALGEYAKKHEKKLGIDTEDEFRDYLEDAANAINSMDDKGYEKAKKEIEKTEESIKNSPEFQDILKLAYDRTFEQMESEKIERGQKFVMNMLPIVGLTSGLALAWYNSRKRG